MKSKVCPICGIQIAPCNLQRHINRHETNPNSFKEKRVDFVCIYCGKVCKNGNSVWHHELACSSNPNRKCNLKNWDWNHGLNAETDDRVKRNRDALKKYYESHEGTFKGKHHTEETKDKLRQQQLAVVHLDNSRHTWSKKGYYNNLFFMSTWELAYYIYMTDKGHKVEKCKKHFEYVYEGIEHNYTPDFIVDDNLIVEIKGNESELDKAKYNSVPNLIVLYWDSISEMIDYVKDKFNIKDLSSLYTT